MTPPLWVNQFCQNIAAARLPNVFNPYSSCCQIHDRPDAAIIRLGNLSRILTHHANSVVQSIWFGRDLGYRGGRRTGLALTDEATMLSGYARIGQSPLVKATHGPIQSERTASVIWDFISRLSHLPVLWNAFPLHPHDSNNPLSNRTHTTKERQETAWTILELTNQFPSAVLIAIGNDASKALTDLGLDHQIARHPSYGGQRDFVAKMEIIHGLQPIVRPAVQKSLFA